MLAKVEAPLYYNMVYVEVYDRYMLGTCLNNIYLRKSLLYKGITKD